MRFRIRWPWSELQDTCQAQLVAMEKTQRDLEAFLEELRTGRPAPVEDRDPPPLRPLEKPRY